MMGMTMLHSTDEDNINDEGSILDEIIRNNEESYHHWRRQGVIQCSQSMTWAVTKSTKQTVGSLLKVSLLDQGRYLTKH